MFEGVCQVCGKPAMFRQRNQFRCTDCRAARQKSGSSKRKSRSSDGVRVRHNRETAKRIHKRCYVGIDGEGINVNGRHIYVYMAAVAYWPDEERTEVFELWDNGAELKTNNILWWLYHTIPKGHFWFYSAGYDWTKIFSTWEKDAIKAVYSPEPGERKIFEPYEHGKWLITKVQGSVTIGRKHIDKEGNEHTFERFFQDGFKCWNGGPFVDKLEEWKIGTPAIWADMRVMKDKRATFSECGQDVRDYCISECDMLARLAAKIVTTASDLSIRPRRGRWYSAGSLAKALLRSHGSQHSRGADRYAGAPLSIRLILMCTFFGGWFDTSGTGHYEVLYPRDLASAYPGIIRDLPCLAHGHWEFKRVAGAINFGHVRWDTIPSANPVWGPLPWRAPDGSVHHPSMGEGWYHESEIVAAQDLPWYQWEELEWISFVPECDHKPLLWIQDIYNMRLALGKDGAGLVLKVALNSIYGTFADTISDDSIFASIVWASIITAATRAKILNVIAKYPSEVVSIATDGILCTEPIDICSAIPKTLGGWDEEPTMRDVLVVQPGLVLAAEGQKKPKTRGHSAKEIVSRRTELQDAWDRDGWDAEVSYKRSRFIPAKLALKRVDFRGTLGQWKTDDVTIKFKPSHRWVTNRLTEGHRASEPSIPMNPSWPDMSSPYSKLMSLELHERLADEQELENAQPSV